MVFMSKFTGLLVYALNPIFTSLYVPGKGIWTSWLKINISLKT